MVRDYIRPTAQVLLDILEEILPPRTPRLKRYLTGMSIVGQVLHHVHCEPVIRLLLAEDYAKLTADVVADQVTEFSLAALGLYAPPTKTARAGSKG